MGPVSVPYGISVEAMGDTLFQRLLFWRRKYLASLPPVMLLSISAHSWIEEGVVHTRIRTTCRTVGRGLTPFARRARDDKMMIIFRPFCHQSWPRAHPGADRHSALLYG